MNNAIQRIDTSPFISHSENEYLIARNAIRLQSLLASEAEDSIIQLINLAYLELGQTPAGSDVDNKAEYVQAMAKLILADLKQYFPEITIKELGVAIHKGLRHEYREKYYGFNVITVHQFVEDYMNSEDRINTLQKQHRYLLTKEVSEELPVENKWQIFKQGMIHCFETYCKTSRIIDLANVNYEFLVNAGVLILSIDQKKVFYNKAEEQVKYEDANMLMTTKDVISRMFAVKSDIKSLAKARAKELALADYFDHNPDFESIIDTFCKFYKHDS